MCRDFIKLKMIIFSFFMISYIFAGPTKVGNGDDGSDLEGFIPIKSGKILISRDKAIEKLIELNVKSIPNLGYLIPELKNSPLYITKKDISTKKLVELGAFTNNEKGLVYARTFPRPHAATRFFPASKGLDIDQLISLHIHEALHRALPKKIRENEDIVSEIALSIVSPDSTWDQINSTVRKYYSGSTFSENSTETSIQVPTKVKREKPASHSRLYFPSKVSIGYTSFDEAEEDGTRVLSIPVSSMYSISSHLYPFGGVFSVLGLGIDAHFLKSDSDESQMGPLGLSARSLLWTVKGFDLELYGRANLNTLSDEELQSSLLGRDVYKFGITMMKKSDYFYVANDLEYTLPSEIENTIGNVDYTYNFGGIIGARVRMGGFYKGLHLGGFGEILLLNDFEIEGGAFSYSYGRNRILAIGPEVEYRFKKVGVKVFGRYLVDSSKKTDFDFLGDIHGRGVGQGNIGLELNMFL